MPKLKRISRTTTCVHTEHCCVVHGCKYGHEDCPVANGQKDQSYPCEECEWHEFETCDQLTSLFANLKEKPNVY